MTPAAYLKQLMRVLGVKEKTAREMVCYREYCAWLDKHGKVG